MTAAKNGALTAAAAVALATTMGVGAASAAYHPGDMTGDVSVTQHVGASTIQLADDAGPFQAMDLTQPANLVVMCNVDGSEMAVGSFEICDLAGGQATSAEI